MTQDQFTTDFINTLKTAQIVSVKPIDQSISVYFISNGLTDKTTSTYACACPDIKIMYGLGFGYSLCSAHNFQQLGRLQFPRQKRTRGPHLEGWERTEQRRKSGYSTEKWYAARGL